MNPLLHLLRVAHCRSTHHLFALDALPLVRTEAGRRLANIRDPAELQPALQPLITALNDPTDKARRIYAKALGNTADPQAVAPLLTLLAEGDKNARSAAAKARARGSSAWGSGWTCKSHGARCSTSRLPAVASASPG